MDLAIFFSIAGLILWALSFLYFRSFIKNRTGRDHILSEFGDEIDKMISEIDAATDRDVTLVEDRIRMLRSLLDETDKRIGSYRKELGRRASEERAYSDLGRRRAWPGQVAALESTTPGSGGAPNNISETGVSLAPSSEGEIEPRIIPSAEPIVPKPHSFSERVAELHRAGFSSELIANRLGATVAEVDLAVALIAKLDGNSSYGHRD